MKKIEENSQRIQDANCSFDTQFWQSQGDLAIFKAAEEMMYEYLRM